MWAHVNTDKVARKMQAIGNVLQRPMRDSLRAEARLVAIESARTSQPFGMGHDAQDMGERAVARDIAKVYKTAGAVWPEFHDKGAAASYWKAIKAGDLGKAQSVQDRYCPKYAGVPIGRWDGGAAHKAARNKTTGRVRLSRPALILATDSDRNRLRRYVEQVQGNVGFGKGGWADVARQLGGTRGLREEGDITANWVSRKAHGLGQVVDGGTDEQPTITITNTVDYADQIFNGTARSTAIRIGEGRFLEYLNHAVKAELRNLRSVA